MRKQKKKYPIEPIWSNYIHAKAKALGIPVSGTFELTSRCNFNCKMCYIHNEDNVQELSAAEWIEIGRKAVHKGMVFLLFTGGEPFLRKDFCEIYSAIRKMGVLVSINTNASLLDDKMIEFLKNEPPLRMNITLYGCSNETYMKLCGRPVFEQVVKNVIKLREAGIQVRLNASITPYNCQDIEGMYKLADKIKVPLKATTYMFPPVRVCWGNVGKNKHRFTSSGAAEYMLKCQEQYMSASELASGYEKEISEEENNSFECEGEPMKCRAGKSAFWITWDGRMLPCGMFADEGYSVKTQGFEMAWENVKAYTDAIRLPAECTGCALRKKCAVCAASCFAETGSSDIRPEYICNMTKKLERIRKNRYGNLNK